MQLQSNYNPDVLTCLANLSNDEVFTPPTVVNQMLDMLPAELFRSSKTKFLDPVSKSGVFLREIAKRLMIGLEEEIPDVRERANHIFTKQLYGMAITELTSLISRRSVYCSKAANGKYSLCSEFDDEQGNIRYRNIEHTFDGGKCMYCGAAISVFGKKARKDLESHAYEFIHTDKPEKIFKNMKFDVIIGNPPYQLDTGGSGRQAKPLYNLFVEQAKKLNPRFLAMIIPARWYAGGMGLDEFRQSMMHDHHIKYLVDYANAKDCFPQNSISGGVCYFLRDVTYNGKCKFISRNKFGENERERYLDEFSVIVRYNTAISIIHKVREQKQPTMVSQISAISPFALPSDFRGEEKEFSGSVKLHCSKGIQYISPTKVEKGKEWIGKYKVLISQTGAEHANEPSSDGRFRVLTSSMKTIGKDGVCTHSYILASKFTEKKHADNLVSYLKTNFVRFLLLQCVTSIHISRSVFEFVPLQDFSRPWTDAMLYEKYGLTEDEIAFIESMIRPME